MKFAHQPGLHTNLITIRNSIFQKNFVKVSRAISELGLISKENIKNLCPIDLVEFGVGYTLTDALILRSAFTPGRTFLFDVEKLLNVRLYAFVSLLNPINYVSKYFWSNLRYLLLLAIFGENAFENLHIYYKIESVHLKGIANNCVVFSNSVLEHISRKDLIQLMNIIQQDSLGKFLFAGIIDANDHSMRRYEPLEQFKNYIGTEEDVQTRGNHLSRQDYELILSVYLKKNEVKILNQDLYGTLVLGIIGKNYD